MILEILFQLLLWPAVQAQSLQTANIPLEVVEASKKPLELVKLDSDVLDVQISAQSALAVDALTGQILYQKNPQEQRSIASITKLMTALVFLQTQPDLNKMVVLKKSDRSLGGIIHINIGEEVKLIDLLHAALIASDNDAAQALASNSGLSIDEFVKRMNLKAQELGMNDTRFIEPTGLHPGNISTVSDLSLLLAEAFKNPLIKKITQKTRYSFDVVGLDGEMRSVKVFTTNQLLTNSYVDVIAGKTGYLTEAGYCLATEINSMVGRPVYIIVLGSQDIESRFSDVKAIEYFLENNYQEL